MAELFKKYVEGMIREIKPTSVVSDLVSENNLVNASDYPQELLYWVDLVLAGGGLHGIAHAGYIYALERAGVRFRSIAGTSAGSIAATFLAAARESPDKPAGTKLLEIMLEMPISTFQDGDPGVVSAVEAITNTFSKQNPSWLSKLTTIWKARHLIQVQTSLGLYKGDAFQAWMDARLKQDDLGVATLADLRDKCNLEAVGIILVDEDGTVERGASATAPPQGSSTTVEMPHPGSPAYLEGVLVVVAADVTTSTKATLSWARPKYVGDQGDGAALQPSAETSQKKPPQMNRPLTVSELYWQDPDGVSPALPVRGSISVPVVFIPMHITDLPAIPANGKSWADVGYSGEAPDEVYLQDGGMLSNFPISLFHVKPGERVWCPTFGVGLSLIRGKQSFSTLTGLLGADVIMSTQFMDREFIRRNPDYNKIIKNVDTTPISATDFNPDLLDRFLLFARGVQAAAEFMPNTVTGDGFDWANYKELRKQLAKSKDFE